MLQSVSVITLGVADLARSKRFYVEGFGWKPVFETPDICFYQMNGFVLGTWRKDALAADLGWDALPKPGASNLGHNLPTREAVAPAIEQLARTGGSVIKPAIEQPYGGFAGYIADPDGHIWEIAWNPAWSIDADGHVTFGA